MTTLRERTLSQVRARIHRARLSCFLSDRLSLANFDSVRSQLVAPVLTALGWNIANPDEVRLSYRVAGSKRDSGIALITSGRPRVLIDVRGMGADLDHRRLTKELLPRAGEAGFEWLLLTDGNEYDIYNAHSDLPVEQRAFDAFRLSDDVPGEALGLLDLFSKRHIEKNGLDSVWECRLVDRKVKRSLEKLLAPDESLVELLLSKTEDLSADDIRSSLARAKVALRFGENGRSQNVHEGTLGCRRVRGASMSDAELRVATWLQRRSIERWAKGAETLSRSRNAQRRAGERRRSRADRRRDSRDRRVSCVETTAERRERRERRSDQRRELSERRLTDDRRRTRRRT